MKKLSTFLKTLLVAVCLIGASSGAWAYTVPSGYEIKDVFIGTNNAGSIEAETFSSGTYDSNIFGPGNLYHASGTSEKIKIIDYSSSYVAAPAVGEACGEGVYPTYVGGTTDATKNVLAFRTRGKGTSYGTIGFNDKIITRGKLVFSVDLNFGGHNKTNAPQIIFVDKDGNSVLQLGFKCNDGDTEYFQYTVNGGTAYNDGTVTASKLRDKYTGHSIRDIVIDMETGKVVYTIDCIGTNGKRYSATTTKDISIGTGKNIAGIRISRDNGSESSKDYYTYMDNMELYTVVPTSATTHTYTIKAKAGDTTISTLATNTCTEYQDYSFYLPKVISYNSQFYVLDGTEFPNYLAYYTMGTANEEREINYTLDESIVHFVEAESSAGTNVKYSNGADGHVNSTHYQSRGKDLGNYIPGWYKATTIVTGETGRGLHIRSVPTNTNVGSDTDNTKSYDFGGFTQSLGEQNLVLELTETKKLILNGANSDTKTNQSLEYDYVILRKQYYVGSATPSISNGAYIPFTLSTMTFTLNDAYGDAAELSILNSATAKLYASDGETLLTTGALSVSGNVVTANFGDYALSAGSDYVITLPAGAVGYVVEETTKASNAASSITVHTAAVADGEYFLKNKATGAYFAAGLSWGTQAITNSIGHYVTVNSVLPAGTYTLNTHIYKSDSNHFLGSDFFCDGASYEWTVEGDGEGYYTISDENGTITAGASGEALSLTSGTGDNTKWSLLTEAEWKAEQVARLDAATANNGVDATFYLPAANFNRCDDDENAKWQGSPAISGLGNNTASTNFNAEKFTDPYATFDVYQALTGVKPGVYKLTAQGFYRNGLDNATDANDNLALLYANSTTVPLVNIRSTGFTDNSHSEEGFSTDKSGYYVPDSQGDASKAFNAGYYQNELNAFVDEDGALRIGVKKEAATGADKDWTCFDNLQLTYYGEAIVNVATAFTNGASMTAGQWYYYDIPYGGVYFLAAESDLDDIVYATDGTLAVGIDGSSFASNTPTLTVIRYYIKSASTQKLSISPKEVESVFDFEDGNNLFTAYNSGKITVSNEASGPSDWAGGRVQKFAYKGKGEHNFAYYSFADLTSSASEVTVDFDFYVTQGAGQNLISIADADYHTGALGGFTSGSNSGYGANGAIFNLGCIRKGSGSSATNYFGVNTTQDTKLGATGLSAWCHATITANNVTRKVTYVIKNASDETIKSGTVDYLNENGLKCTQIDVYTGATSADSPIYIDNLSITSTVNSVSATLGTNGYGTFASPYPLDLANLPEGLTAYKASTISGKTVTFTAVTEAVQANTGLLLKGDAGESETIVSIPVAASGADISASNKFLVNTAGTTFTGDDNYYYFGLKKNTLTFGLFDPSKVAIPANKAYLEVLKSSVDASRSLSIVFDDEATAVFDLNDKSEMINDKWYDLQGRRVDGSRLTVNGSRLNPGIYIKNGRKVVVK